MRIWQKNITPTEKVDNFTVGEDRNLDIHLASADILGSLAHTQMLETIGLLTKTELDEVQTELKKLYAKAQNGEITISDTSEDIHSEVESILTQILGDTGKKIHSGRSRNDQVLVDMRIFLRREIHEITGLTKQLCQKLLSLADTHKDVLIPGYTHLQVAMPSSFGLWFSAYAESLADDLYTMVGAYKIINKNPLGSAAGYGSSFPLDRELTTSLLGFDDLSYNVVTAQMGRGKSERVLAQAMANIAASLGKFAMDNALYLSQNFAFISYPPELTTGSSIMPHKKNPDVWEIMRGKCNLLQALPNQIAMLTTNLPSGYHRELQLLKEVIIPAINSLKSCLDIAHYMLCHVSVNDGILEDSKYDYIFSVETVNNLVLNGIPFREAYVKVGLDIENGEFKPSRSVNHTHSGSIGNLKLDSIEVNLNNTIQQFDFQSFINAEQKLTQLF